MRNQKRPVVEVALFFDEAGYKIFAPYMNNDEKQMRDMLLAYMNGVSNFYNHKMIVFTHNSKTREVSTTHNFQTCTLTTAVERKKITS